MSFSGGRTAIHRLPARAACLGNIRANRLEALLNGIPEEREGMSLAELDGYVACLIVCPEVIPPSEWLAAVWGGEDAFADVAEAEEIISAVMGHYNQVASDLANDPESYAPILEVVVASDEVLWEPWIDGFERAMRLRSDAWGEIVESDDEEAAASVSLILTMNDIYNGRDDLSDKAVDELDRTMPDMIPTMVRCLNAWTKSRGVKGGAPVSDVGHDWYGIDDVQAFGRKVGRNEPCPCGSGRKYKRCCGAN
ncbi:MAG: UPF0149 family protein [Rhodospirillaceae bacterium]|nr:UPF0149 family protein [Rhodospirillaceae bacterium]